MFGSSWGHVQATIAWTKKVGGEHLGIEKGTLLKLATVFSCFFFPSRPPTVTKETGLTFMSVSYTSAQNLTTNHRAFHQKPTFWRIRHLRTRPRPFIAEIPLFDS